VISITNRPFPIIKGKDAARVAMALQDSRRMPPKDSLDHKLMTHRHEQQLNQNGTVLKRRVLYED